MVDGTEDVATMENMLPNRLTRERLQGIVDAVSVRLHDPQLRKQSQRAVQAKVWHSVPSVSLLMRELKSDEVRVKSLIQVKISSLVYEFHSNTIDATLARAGITSDDRLLLLSTPNANRGSNAKDGDGDAEASRRLLTNNDDLDLRCLDAKERLYLLLKQFDWLRDFFQSYPHHFYENSFSFVSRIPTKPLRCRALVLGLGVGGSMACSGMAKHGIDVTGIEKRERPGSRYQNASWRAYDTAHNMVDDDAFQELARHRQRILVAADASGNSAPSVITFSDRVQIVIGHAIETAIGSARRYGARLRIGGTEGGEIGPSDVADSCDYDLCVVFCGARTSSLFPTLDLQIHSWPRLESTCKMWLQLQPNIDSRSGGEDDTDDEAANSCTRHGEIGAENWDFTISSTRRSEEDLERLLYNLDSQHSHKTNPSEEVTAKYRDQRRRVEAVLEQLQNKRIRSYQYTFTNAPSNDHNLSKLVAVSNNIAIDGGYSVPVQIATRSSFGRDEHPSETAACDAFRSQMVVCGGDATVPPNPLAAYGATLACEAAYSSVQLAVAIGHLNAILYCFDDRNGEHAQWCRQVVELRNLFRVHYEARSRAENYFQFIQTLLCNLYSLPPQVTTEA